MILDRKNGPWAAVCGAALAVAAALYVPYHRGALNGPSGGTLPGLAYGIAGFALLLFVGLLGFRRYFPAWRIGRPETWLRGHLWLGLLGTALIAFHSGFGFGGTLTTVMMWLLILLTLSGAAGVVLQQILPRVMTSQVKMETIYEQVDHVVLQLRDEARAKIEEACGLLGDEVSKAAPSKSREQKRPWSGVPDTKIIRMAPAEVAGEGAPVLKTFYLQVVRPYLEGERRNPLADRRQAAHLFVDGRTLMPPPLHETLDDLQSICEEYRQLRNQEFLHHCLHGWLLVHVPLSYAFLVLALVHAVYALRY